MQALYENLPATRDEFTLAALKLARKVAKNVTRSRPYLRDDAYGAMGVRLAKFLANPLPGLVDVADFLSMAFFRAGVRELEHEAKHAHGRAVDPYAPEGVDVLADVLEVCEYATDSAIVQARAQGYTDKEIAPLVGMSQQGVSARRKKLRERYDS